MTGDQALLCMELAVLRVRDRALSYPHDNMSLAKALDDIAGHLAEFSNQERLARKAETARAMPTSNQTVKP